MLLVRLRSDHFRLNMIIDFLKRHIESYQYLFLPFRHIWRDPGKFDEGVVRHSERSVPESFPKLAETLGAVCCQWRKLLWRRQTWISCIYQHKVFITTVWSFIDQTLYLQGPLHPTHLTLEVKGSMFLQNNWIWLTCNAASFKNRILSYTTEKNLITCMLCCNKT